MQQAARGSKPGISQHAVSVQHPGHVLYPLEEDSGSGLQVLAAFVPAGLDIDDCTESCPPEVEVRDTAA